jgi:hypothetical protein
MFKSMFSLVMLLLLSGGTFAQTLAPSSPADGQSWIIREVIVSEDRKYHTFIIHPLSPQGLDELGITAASFESEVAAAILKALNAATVEQLRDFPFGKGDQPTALLRQIAGLPEPIQTRGLQIVNKPEQELRQAITQSVAFGHCPTLDQSLISETKIKEVYDQILDPQTPWLTTLRSEVRELSGRTANVRPIRGNELKAGRPLRIHVTLADDRRVRITLNPSGDPYYECVQEVEARVETK